jgi:pyruvate,water dikinase
MRSSAVGEDSRSSFAGQYRTVLNVTEDDIIHAYKKVIASKYSPRALYYRINYGLSDMETPMAVIALEMVDAAVSGVIYTEDVACQEAECLAIHAIWGLGELLVSGQVSPDIIRVRKQEAPEVTERKIGTKSSEMIYSGKRVPEMLRVDEDRRGTLCLDDASAVTLARWAMALERHFKEPQDIEWGLDREGRLFLLQSRPLRRQEVVSKPLECDFEGIKNTVLVSFGDRASSGIGAGPVFRVEEESDLESVPEGAVLVSRDASPQWVTALDRVAAVVTDFGSTAGHFSSVAREFGVPALLNTGIATDRLPQGKEVTVYADGQTVYEGVVPAMVESPCARRDPLEESPFARKLKQVMGLISPLTLVDPQASNFEAGNVRSFHDIIRFSHERAVQDMFHAGDRRLRKIPGSKKLVSDIPMIIYVLDVGGGLKENLAEKKTVGIDEVESLPMQAVFKGLCHPDIHWGDFSHFDWAAFDRTVMSGGIISPESAVFSSYGVVSSDYLNLNLRFGYHFVILDTICCDKAEDNYILFRFAGGGADVYGKSLRAEFLKGVLKRLGFEVENKADLVDARLKGGDKAAIMEKLDLLGRLLGVARLLDMYLKDPAMVEGYIEDFMNGRYRFGVSRQRESSGKDHVSV